MACLGRDGEREIEERGRRRKKTQEFEGGGRGERRVAQRAKERY